MPVVWLKVSRDSYCLLTSIYLVITITTFTAVVSGRLLTRRSWRTTTRCLRFCSSASILPEPDVTTTTTMAQFLSKFTNISTVISWRLTNSKTIQLTKSTLTIMNRAEANLLSFSGSESESESELLSLESVHTTDHWTRPIWQQTTGNQENINRVICYNCTRYKSTNKTTKYQHLPLQNYEDIATGAHT